MYELLGLTAPKFGLQSKVYLPSGTYLYVLGSHLEHGQWVYRLGNDWNERNSNRRMWVKEKHLKPDTSIYIHTKDILGRTIVVGKIINVKWD